MRNVTLKKKMKKCIFLKYLFILFQYLENEPVNVLKLIEDICYKNNFFFFTNVLHHFPVCLLPLCCCRPALKGEPARWPRLAGATSRGSASALVERRKHTELGSHG